jgi:hypothetical protein
MKIMEIKSNYLNAIFVVLFALYSISPLSLTVADGVMAGNIASPEPSPSFAGNIRIFFWELMCSQLVSDKDCTYPATTDRILVRKARAVMSGNLISQITLLGDLPAQCNLFQPYAVHTRRIFPELVAEKPHRGAIPLCSGLSPPLS